MRKDAGFAVEDRIEISWDLDGQIAAAVGKFDAYFRNETLTNHISENLENADHSESVELKEKTYTIKLKRI
jgi:hypothetical protein